MGLVCCVDRYHYRAAPGSLPGLVPGEGLGVVITVTRLSVPRILNITTVITLHTSSYIGNMRQGWHCPLYYLVYYVHLLSINGRINEKSQNIYWYS